ncbi:MAG: tetratricopeptide repeat protein [Pseudomonadales bacterium]|jgi:tetratricopeptide (TPR) repeat protein|nr:tetratricopeptide repeat protein [Gammaproteobacteria bacterium]MBP6051743.1 tetratricopeptide repeat protein [Pseudomonadales bacterium]MBP6226665.1 tetratricopeptide repeat protein [Pseudomonadales bacterium]
MSISNLHSFFAATSRLARVAAGVVLTGIMVACSGAAQPVPAAVTAPEPLPASAEPTYRPFPEDTLYALLVAEFAARRGVLDVALGNYLQQAARTHDAGVAARATRMARYFGADRATLEAALLWAAAEPEEPEAQFTAATELARAGRPREAFAHMRAAHDAGGASNFAVIAASSLELAPSERREMLAELEALGPGNEVDVLIARAVLLQSVDENELALARVREVLALDPDNYQAILIEAQVYQNLGDTEKAYARIEQALRDTPDNTRLRLQYARLLAKTDLARSEEQFRILVAQQPDDAELRLSLALVYHETGQFERMSEQLNALLAAGQQLNAAHFYLGQEAERQGDNDAAIAHYLEVKPSPMFIAALARGCELISRTRGPTALGEAMTELRARWPDQKLRLLLLESELRVESKDYDGAWRLLSNALAEQPEEPALLYARSMVSEKRGDVAAMEQDLRRMLALDPDNSLALNALGYSLANLTDRFAEALALISHALELKPDDPAILDSMGWVQYRLGNLELALENLRKAFDRFPDHEVAAHLGEVLWVMGRTDEARLVWGKGLAGTPDSAIIRATTERLGVSPPVQPEPAPAP